MPLSRALALAGGVLAFLALMWDRRHLQDDLPWLDRGGLGLLLIGSLAALAFAFDAPRASPSLQFVARPLVFWPALLAGAMLWLVLPRLG